MSFQLPDLGYDYNALEPYIDARTMEIHYTKHHAAYTANLNKAVEGTALEGVRIEDLFAKISTLPAAVRNNGGGYYNHNLYWSVMGPSGGGKPSGALMDAITGSFGSYADFKSQFSTAAATRFGSGWAWLVKKADGSLEVSSTPNQDNPLMDLPR
jgi:Fe-Mn family superoxide dismutase